MGEVGDFHGPGAGVEGEAGEFGDAAPLGEVVDVHVQREAVVQTVNQTVVHQEVHAVVATDTAGHLLDFRSEERGAVLRHQLIEFCAFVDLFAAVGTAQADLWNGVFAGETVRAHELVAAVVGAGGHDVVLQEDRPAARGADHRHREVTPAERDRVFARLRFEVAGAVEGGRVHGHKRLKPVATVDPQRLADRAETVCGVEVPTAVAVQFDAPVVVAPAAFEVVVVGAFGMDNLAEKAAPGHLQGGEFEAVVAAVLEDRAMAAGALGGLHEGPALIQRLGGRDFQGDMLAVLHRVDGYFHVRAPVRADVDKVHGGVLAERAVVRVRGEGAAGIRRVRQTGAEKFGVYVAEGCEVAAGDIGKPLNGFSSAHAKTDNSDTDVGDGLCAELKHIRPAFLH